MEQGGSGGLRHGLLKTETKLVGGRNTWWKVLEGAWVVGMRGSEFRCYMECNTGPCFIREIFKQFLMKLEDWTY